MVTVADDHVAGCRDLLRDRPQPIATPTTAGVGLGRHTRSVGVRRGGRTHGLGQRRASYRSSQDRVLRWKVDDDAPAGVAAQITDVAVFDALHATESCSRYRWCIQVPAGEAAGGGQRLARTYADPMDDLARRIVECCRLSGSFQLRSGQVSDTYFDKYLFESDPSLLREVAAALEPLVPAGTEVLAGLELGGVPVATALSLSTGIPAVFVRKEAKAYGTAKLAEGCEIDGRRVLIVEDVITTGGQVLLSAADLRDRGAVIQSALSVIDRSNGCHRLIDGDLALSSLFTAESLGAAELDVTAES